MELELQRKLLRMENKLDFLITELVSYDEKGNIDLDRFEPKKDELKDIWNKDKSEITENIIKARVKNLSREDMIKAQNKAETKERIKSQQAIVAFNWNEHICK